MHRIQAQLPAETVERLRALARREQVSIAELLRRGAVLVLEQDPGNDDDTRRARARSAIGRFSDGEGIAGDHDRHLDEAFGA